MSRVYTSLALALLVLGCADREPKGPPGLPSGPPPLPTVKAPESATGAAPAADESQVSPQPEGAQQAERVLRSGRAPKSTKPSVAKKAAQGSAPQPSPAVSPPAPTAAPLATPAPAAVKPASRVTVPSTAHVHPELPSGLQRDLDADPRMQSWLDRAFAVIDGCHNQNRAATGTIEVVLTMHENERPDADIRALPPALSAVVACSTGALMRTKMPLFTGAEGTRYTTRIRFD